MTVLGCWASLSSRLTKPEWVIRPRLIVHPDNRSRHVPIISFDTKALRDGEITSVIAEMRATHPGAR